MSFIASPPPSRHGGGYFPRSNSARTPYTTLERPDLFPLLRSLQEDPSFAEVLRASESKETKKGKRMSGTSIARGRGTSGLGAGGVGSSGLWPGLLSPSRSGSSHAGGEGRRTQTPAERYAAQHRRRSQVISTASSAVGSQMALEVQEAPRAYIYSPHQGSTVSDGQPVGLWELLERPARSAVNTTGNLEVSPSLQSALTLILPSDYLRKATPYLQNLTRCLNLRPRRLLHRVFPPHWLSALSMPR